MSEYKFYDISALAEEKDRMSRERTSDKWQIIDYEASDFRGKLLFAEEKCKPEPITLNLNLEGKYHVYLGMINPRGETVTNIGRLSEGRKTQIYTLRPDKCWKPCEWFEESYYGEVDMTGEKFVLSKPALDKVNSALAFIRLVSSNEQTTDMPKPCMAYHFDLDYFSDDAYQSVKETTGRIAMLKDGAPEIILHEKLPLFDLCAEREKGIHDRWGDFYLEHFEEEDRAIIAEAHSMGSKAYASYRVQAGGFGLFADFLNSSFEDEWFSSRPEYRCVARDGRVVATSSFAYPEVRRRVVDTILNGIGDYDGVCVFFHRGTLIAFEEPVCRMVREKYGVDARRLPMSDSRLYTVMGYFITLFMKELREELDKLPGVRKEINAIVYHSPEKSLHFGYNVEEWISGGLVDSISQGLMTHFEDLEGIVDEEGLIDLDKYKEANRERAVLRRDYSPDYTLVTEGAKEFLKICEGKVDFYATLAWQGTVVENAVRLVEGLRALGVKKFLSWNTNHKIRFLPRLNVEKFYAAGSSELYESRKSRYFRALSFNDWDIANYNIDWKG